MNNLAEEIRPLLDGLNWLDSVLSVTAEETEAEWEKGYFYLRVTVFLDRRKTHTVSGESIPRKLFEVSWYLEQKGYSASLTAAKINRWEFAYYPDKK